MATKLKKICEKICRRRITRAALIAVIFAGLAVMALGTGIAGRVSQMDGTLRDLILNEYTDSKLHKRDVERTIDELWNQIWDRMGIDLAYDGTRDTFPGMEDIVFDFILNAEEGSGILKLRSNIPGRKEGPMNVDASYLAENFTCYYIWDGEELTFGDDVGDYVRNRLEMPLGSESVKIGIGFDTGLLESGQERLGQLNEDLFTGVSFIVVGLLAAFLGAAVLILGKKQRQAMFLYTDIAVLLSAAGGVTGVIFIAGILENFVDLSKETYGTISDLSNAAGFSISMMLALFGVYEIVKNIRRHMGFQQLFFMDHLRRIKQKIIGEAYYDQGIRICTNNRERMMIWLTVVILAAGAVGVFYLSMKIWYFICVGLLAVVLMCYRRGSRKIAEEYAKLLGQLNQLLNENYQDNDMLDESSVFARESCQLSMLGCQIQESVERQIQAEKMKIDLITNVSHDLKTPLTSIISYIDLLKKEDLEQVARDYVMILEKKSERLKKMISDVFDLTKATSGNLEIKKSELDFGRLLIQILADMECIIEPAPVKVVSDIPEQPLQICSDGEKLYRVIQNILDNALKYAMPDTRIFVTLKEEGREAVLQVKNVSAYEMNFTREEVLGRFFRGDCARSTEGSGLGLAVAKEFTESCGGRMDLMISGDIFQVELRFYLRERGLTIARDMAILKK